MGALDRTWTLFKQSFAVLNADVEIVLFPVLPLVSLDRALAVIVAVGYVVILAAIMSAAKGVFTAALYRCASRLRDAPNPLWSELVDRALQAR